MESREIAQQLDLLARLLELHDQNSFKARAYQAAAFRIKKTGPAQVTRSQELKDLPGMGAGTLAKVEELLNNGVIEELEAWLQKTPPGLVDILGIKGLGPKKVGFLWRQLGIETVGELEYACLENRIAAAKGFGQKTQQELLHQISFLRDQEGKYHLARLWEPALELCAELENKARAQGIEVVAINEILKGFEGNSSSLTEPPGSGVWVCPSGEILRQCSVISRPLLLCSGNPWIDLLGSLGTWKAIDPADVHADWGNAPIPDWVTRGPWQALRLDDPKWGQTWELIQVPETEGASAWNWSLGSPEFLKACTNSTQKGSLVFSVNAQGTPRWDQTKEAIAPPMREEALVRYLEHAAKHQPLPGQKSVRFNDLKGALHNHTTASDGVHSLKEMQEACISRGWNYLGICDHSQAAFYANGLDKKRLQVQAKEIDELNASNGNFVVFKGIECDILNDGQLDLDNETLSQLDFVVASVHSNLKMSPQKSTERLLQALENPWVTILGHPTGRLLLARPGYNPDMERVLQACARNQVVVEINANPKRLDLDWPWIYRARELGLLFSINPDAHSTEGLLDMQWGVRAAQKAGLEAELCINTWPTDKIRQFFAQRNQNAGQKSRVHA